MTEPRGRVPTALTILLFTALSLSLRLPFAAEAPHHIDELNFLRALDNYDLEYSSPHAPGYPLFVVVGRLLWFFCDSPMLAFQIANGIGAGIAAFALGDIARRIFGNAAARWTAGLVLISPLSWSYGFCALSYEAASGVTALAIRESCLVLLGQHRRLPVAGLLLGISTGFRLEAPIFLFPILAWAIAVTIRGGIPSLAGASLIATPGNYRRGLLTLLLFAAGAAVSLFIPIYSVGGIERFRQLSQSAQTVSHLFRPDADYLTFLKYNLTIFSTSAILVLGALWVPIFFRFSSKMAVFGRPVLFLLFIWSAPSLAYYIVFHQGQYGYWLPTLAQPVWIASGAILAGMNLAPAALAIALNAALVLCGGLFAVDYPRAPLRAAPQPGFLVEFTTFYLQRYTAAGIAIRDKRSLELMNFLKTNYSPDESWIFTSPRRWMDWSSDHIMFQLPEFLSSVATAPVAHDAPIKQIPAKGRTILIVHADMMEACDSPDRFTEMYEINEFDNVWEARTSDTEVLWFEAGKWGIAPGRN